MGIAAILFNSAESFQQELSADSIHVAPAMVWSFVVMNLALSGINYKISKSVTLTLRS